MTYLLFLAHQGEGATWQALVTTLSLGFVVVFLLVLAGRLEIKQPDDALLPLAAVAVIAAVAPTASGTLSDWVGWALPGAIVLLVALSLHTFGIVSLHPPGPLAAGVVAVAVVASLLLWRPIADTLHPGETMVFAPVSDDATLAITVPAVDGPPIAGQIVVEVAVSGGTVLPSGIPTTVAVPDDPEELMSLSVFVDGERHIPQVLEDCTADAPCTTVHFPVELGAGSHTVTVELLSTDPHTRSLVAFESALDAELTFEVAPAP